MTKITDRFIDAIMHTEMQLITRFDDGLMTKEDLALRLRSLVTSHINAAWDDGFKAGVNEVEKDEDDNFEDEYEIDLEDEDFDNGKRDEDSNVDGTS